MSRPINKTHKLSNLEDNIESLKNTRRPGRKTYRSVILTIITIAITVLYVPVGVSLCYIEENES